MEQLRMETLNAAVPEVAMPEGWHIRSSREGDGAAWCLCCKGGALGVDEDMSEAHFVQVMPKDVAREDVLYIESEDGHVGGTATLWVKPEDKTLGWVHMVGVNPDSQGKRLSAPVCAQVMRNGAARGCTHFSLLTDDFRIPAIRTYLKLGFLPVVKDEAMAQRWRALLPKVGRESVMTTDGAIIRGE